MRGAQHHKAHSILNAILITTFLYTPGILLYTKHNILDGLFPHAVSKGLWLSALSIVHGHPMLGWPWTIDKALKHKPCNMLTDKTH